MSGPTTNKERKKMRKSEVESKTLAIVAAERKFMATAREEGGEDEFLEDEMSLSISSQISYDSSVKSGASKRSTFTLGSRFSKDSSKKTEGSLSSQFNITDQVRSGEERSDKLRWRVILNKGQSTSKSDTIVATSLMPTPPPFLSHEHLLLRSPQMRKMTLRDYFTLSLDYDETTDAMNTKFPGQLIRRASESDLRPMSMQNLFKSGHILKKLPRPVPDDVIHQPQRTVKGWICGFPGCGQVFMSENSVKQHQKQHELRSRLGVATPMTDQYLMSVFPKDIPWKVRECEERSDEATRIHTLLLCEEQSDKTTKIYIQPSPCEERSDEATRKVIQTSPSSLTHF